ncbi:hypothetical protein QEZ40_000581 [Streptomyces katrae]|uniref:Uncharacterized protein n=1 Tax=Streptomyces katrae TaxID=68223 RepID=A0ABT7H895_9ACTN|nr:hypothetical protein [Streptomyces katrae]MDK9501304.1 hypothetical protein [Streptomyces katrae]
MAAAWTTARAVTRLTVLRAHLIDDRRLQRLLGLQRQTGIHLTLVVHRPRLTTAAGRTLAATDHTTVDAPPPGAPASVVPAPWRWITLDALDRLVSYDSPRPCTTACTPRPIVYQQRPAPIPPTQAQAVRLADRLHTATSHPARAAALAAAVAVGTSFQQLATARPDGFDPAASTLTLHDQARYTDGCAIYPAPAWAHGCLHAAARFAHLTDAACLLAAPADRPALLRLAESIKIRPPQPPPAWRGERRGRSSGTGGSNVRHWDELCLCCVPTGGGTSVTRVRTR